LDYYLNDFKFKLPDLRCFMKDVLIHLKPYLKWISSIGVIFFLGKTLVKNWREVASIRLDGEGSIYLGIGLLLTLIAYGLGGLIWSWVLRECNYSLSSLWLIRVYLRTNLAKYLPGNVWHYYSRITTVKTAKVSTGTATFSVFIEPLLLSAAALLVILGSSHFILDDSDNTLVNNWQVLGLGVLLLSLHPVVLNPVLRFFSQFKTKGTEASSPTLPVTTLQVRRYPVMPLLGSVFYMGLRNLGFLFVFFAFTRIGFNQLPLLFNAFSLAWLASVIIPAAPGGIGVFEATAISLLGQPFSTGLVLSITAVYRLINTLAETLGAGLASIGETDDPDR
jgi:uncharacterized membrane protein YbhN (UPF0104 family)